MFKMSFLTDVPPESLNRYMYLLHKGNLQTTYATGTASKQVSMPASDIEVLNYSIMNGMIDPVFVREQIEMQKRKEILEQHPFSIWQGKNGSWYTYLLNEEGERVLKKRKNQQSLEDLVIEYYRSAVPTVKSWKTISAAQLQSII